MAKATDGLAFGVTRHCRIKGYRPCRRPQHLGGGGQSVRLKQLQFIGWLGITVYWMVGYTDNSGNVEVIDAEGLC